LIYITPRYSGSQRHWQLQAEDIISANLNDPGLLAHPKASRESKAHLAIYHALPDVKAIIHAHPFHVLPFCAANQPIPPVLEGTRKFGIVECVPAAPAHSAELAENVVAGLRSKQENVRVQAAGVLIHYHGIIVAGKNLLAAVDALERIDWNAWCILAQRLLPGGIEPLKI
jgi:ribulose-5-phosphate 4-epimerase/fuculose-1-phosphate aldolase